jgi:O-antigen/teichoic acid export membrane protein
MTLVGRTAMSSPSDQYVHLSRGATYLMIQSLGLNAVTIVSFLILARLISTKEMGIWAILLLINAACQAFATWFAPAVTKFVAENATKSPATAAAAFYQALRITSVMYLPIVTAMYLGASFMASRILGDISYAPLFQALAIDVFFWAGVLPVVTAGLLGLQMFRQTATVSLVVEGFIRQSLVISLILLMKNLVGLVIGGLVADVATALIYLALAKRVLGAPRFDFPVTKLLSFSLPLELSQIAGFAQTWFDRALLAALVPLSILGIYNVALTAFGALTGISSAIANMLFPAYSSIQEKKETHIMSNAIGLAIRYTNLMLVPLAFGLLATAKIALTVLVGESYVGGYLPLSILCAAFALSAFATALGPVLLSREETTLFALITGITVLMGLAVAYVLLPAWGIVGASAARASAMILAAVLTVLILKKTVSIQFDFRAIAKQLFAGAVMAVLVVAVQLLEYSRLLLPLYFAVGAAVYLVMLRLLKAVDVADLNLLQRFLGARLSFLSIILSQILLPRDSLSHVITKG